MLRVEDLKGRVVFWDFDGVLMPYRATALRTHVDQEEYVEKFIVDKAMGSGVTDLCNHNVYNHLTTPAIVSRLVNDLDSNNIFVLTAVSSVFEFEAKKRLIADKYRNFREDHILFVGHSAYKARLMDKIYLAYYSDNLSRDKMVLIDDTVELLESVEKLGFTGYHVSMLL